MIVFDEDGNAFAFLSIVDFSCCCGLCTSIFFRVYWKAVRNNDEYPNLSIDTEDHLGLWETILEGWSLFDMDLESESIRDWTWFQPYISSSSFGEEDCFTRWIPWIEHDHLWSKTTFLCCFEHISEMFVFCNSIIFVVYTKINGEHILSIGPHQTDQT